MKPIPKTLFFAILLVIPLAASLACAESAPENGITADVKVTAPVSAEVQRPPVVPGDPLYGFFPSPSEVTIESVMATFNAIDKHGNVVLVQPAIPWAAFKDGVNEKDQKVIDIRNQYELAARNNLEVIHMVDALNGLNRTEFAGLPFGWEASFSNPRVRQAFSDYTLWVVRQFKPRYLGLASEINTYADAHPEDFASFLSLYAEVYDRVKAEAPETQVFVSFQWEDLNNLIQGANENRQPYQTNWDQVEAFEPRLDLWVISSYPFVAFRSSAEIPDNYYSRLLARTTKPLAVAEGGFTSQPVGPFPGSPEDQVGYLNAIHSQIGNRLLFWIYLLISDFNLDSYAPVMRRQGMGDDIDTLGMFASVGLRNFDGSPKPALAVWDDFQTGTP